MSGGAVPEGLRLGRNSPDAIAADKPRPGGQRLPRRTQALFLATVVLAIALRLPFLSIPLERDEGAYAYIAVRLLAGDTLYVDVFDHKPPVIYLVYSAVIAVAGQSVLSIRIAGLLASVISLGLVFAIGRYLWGDRPALLASGIFAVFASSVPLQGFTFNSEAIAVPLVLGALLCTLKADRHNFLGYLLAAGFLVGIAAWCKPVAGLCLIGLTAAAAFGMPPKRALVGFALIAAGFLAASVPFLVSFLVAGIVPEALTAIFGVNDLYMRAGILSLEQRAGSLYWVILALVFPAALMPAWFCGLVGMWIGLVMRRSRPHLLLALWTGACYLGVKASARELGHYYLMLVPLMSLWAGYGLTSLLPLPDWSVPKNQGPAMLRVALLTMSALLFFSYALNARNYYGTGSRNVLAGAYDPVGAALFSDAPRVAELVQKMTGADDYVFVFGSEPEIYFYSGRRSSSRFIFLDHTDFIPGAWEVMMSDLERNPPVIVVVPIIDDDARVAAYLSARGFAASNLSQPSYSIYQAAADADRIAAEHVQ